MTVNGEERRSEATKNEKVESTPRERSGLRSV